LIAIPSPSILSMSQRSPIADRQSEDLLVDMDTVVMVREATIEAAMVVMGSEHSVAVEVLGAVLHRVAAVRSDAMAEIPIDGRVAVGDPGRPPSRDLDHGLDRGPGPTNHHRDPVTTNARNPNLVLDREVRKNRLVAVAVDRERLVSFLTRCVWLVVGKPLCLVLFWFHMLCWCHTINSTHSLSPLLSPPATTHHHPPFSIIY